MGQQKGISFKEFRQWFQKEEACEYTCLGSVGRMDLSARSVEAMAAVGFMRLSHFVE